jgi:hypothetical protein
MNKRILELARGNLMHERWSRYGESIEEEYYDFSPEELIEFANLIINEVLIQVKDEVQYATNWDDADIIVKNIRDSL